MHIVVLVKQVPDTFVDRSLVLETGLVDRSGDAVVDEISERAVEAALVVRDADPGSTVTAVSMGPERAVDALRKALSMGADDAVHVVADGLVGADLTLTAEVLAAAIRTLSPDLVVAGNVSTDGSGGVLAAMLAEHLAFAQATNLATLAVEAGSAAGTRVVDGGTVAVTAALPAVVSVTEALPDPRFPNFKGIMAAKKKPLVTMTAEELDADVLGERAARAIVLAATTRPARAAGTTIVDDGEGGTRLAEYLIAHRLA